MSLVERDDLVARTAAAHAAARAGHGSIAAVSGEAGAGKTFAGACGLSWPDGGLGVL